MRPPATVAPTTFYPLPFILRREAVAPLRRPTRVVPGIEIGMKTRFVDVGRAQPGRLRRLDLVSTVLFLSLAKLLKNFLSLALGRSRAGFGAFRLRCGPSLCAGARLAFARLLFRR